MLREEQGPVKYLREEQGPVKHLCIRVLGASVLEWFASHGFWYREGSTTLFSVVLNVVIFFWTKMMGLLQRERGNESLSALARRINRSMPAVGQAAARLEQRMASDRQVNKRYQQLVAVLDGEW